MEKYDPRIDAYIERSAGFAQPILKHLRELVHKASPKITETIKWSFPHFDHKGTVCSMAAFKEHCAFGFWKSTLLPDTHKLLSKPKEAMGHLGKITSVSDLPSDDILIEYIRNAVKLNEEGIKVPGKKPAGPRTEIEIPEYFTELLEEYPNAKYKFENFSYSHKKEYVEWFNEAKTEETRHKRMNTAVEWISEGKSRNWKYERKKE